VKTFFSSKAVRSKKLEIQRQYSERAREEMNGYKQKNLKLMEELKTYNELST
jgi:hypothetical protein